MGEKVATAPVAGDKVDPNSVKPDRLSPAIQFPVPCPVHVVSRAWCVLPGEPPHEVEEVRLRVIWCPDPDTALVSKCKKDC
jgi:hypothetical protein